MGDKANTFAAKAALPILLFFAILRALISLDPSLDVHLEYGEIHVQLVHVASVAVWFSVSWTCLSLLRTIVISSTSTRLQFDTSAFHLGIRNAFVAVVAIPYVVWIISFIYEQWVSSFAIFFQLIYAIPSITFFVHTIYQAYFVFSAWKCLRNSRSAPIKLSWQATWTNILYNSVMIAHMASVAVFTIRDKGIYQLPMWFIANELYYRLMAICVFYRIYYKGNWYDPVEAKDEDCSFQASLVTSFGTHKPSLSPVHTCSDEQARDCVLHLCQTSIDYSQLYMSSPLSPVQLRKESIVVLPTPSLPHDRSDDELRYSCDIQETTPQPEIIVA